MRSAVAARYRPWTRKNGADARRIDPPFGDTAVGRQTAVQRTAGGAVLVFLVDPHDGAQPLDIEKSVLEFQRIEGPLDQRDAARQGILTLPELQAAAHLRVAILRQHAQHVTVQVRVPVRLNARNGEAEADHPRAIVGAENMAAHFARHHQKSQGQQFDIGKTPDRSSATPRLLRIPPVGITGEFRSDATCSSLPATGPPFRRW